MVNLVAAEKQLLHGLIKLAGLRPQIIEIEPGTQMIFWVPAHTLKNDGKKSNKPVVVLVHGFAAEGLVTWQFQIGSLTKKYDVYVPDLLLFGGSVTDSDNRSPAFQAECLVKALGKLGVERCTAVGFSYGGMVLFKMAEKYPELIEALVVSGSVVTMTDSISSSQLESIGFSSHTEMLLPNSVKGLKTLLTLATYKKLWFPEKLYRDFLEVMFNNRKERVELLEGLVISNQEVTIPKFTQKIHLLWGENDLLFNIGIANNMKEQLGEKATLQGIKKGGHLVHLERQCMYNRCLKKFLASEQCLFARLVTTLQNTNSDEEEI